MRAQTVTISIDPNRDVTVTLKRNCLNLFDHSTESLWTFDLEGRLVGMYVDRINYRRTLDNRFFRKCRRKMNGETFRSVNPVSQQFATELIGHAKILLQKVDSHLPGETIHLGQKILDMDMSKLQKSAKEFHKIYLPISVLPPDQYMSLVLQITEGCHYNQCVFCNFYRDRPFRIKSLQEVEKHILEVRRFFGEGLKLRRSIFLADANALALSQNRIIAILKVVKDLLPEFPTSYSFMDVFIGIKKTVNDFSELRELGMKRVYLGVESGNEQLLGLLKKPQPIDNIVTLARRIKEGGINLGVIFLVGAGGRSFFSKHLNDSIQLIKKIPLDRFDLVYISEFYEINEEYRSILQNMDIALPDRLEIRDMANEFKSRIKEVVPKDVAVPIYDIQQFFY